MDGHYDPDLYDLITPETFGGDVEWYRRKAVESGGPVLELGAGTGRVTRALAAAGMVVHALDASQAMLSALHRKLAGEPADVRARIVAVPADMRTFRLDTSYPLVIAPFRAILHNLTEDDQLACFQRVREHLRPGGCFAFNVFHPSLEYMAQHAGALAGVWRWASTVRTADGGWVVRSEANRYDTVRQRVHSQHKYDDYGPDGVLRRTFLHPVELALLYPSDIRQLLTRAGFQSVAIWGGFDGRPFERDADELVIEARI